MFRFKSAVDVLFCRLRILGTDIMLNLLFKNLENQMLSGVSDLGNFQSTIIVCTMQTRYSIVEFNITSFGCWFVVV